MIFKITYPILFNPYKHHLNFLREEIGRCLNSNDFNIYKMLHYIGSNCFDLYAGSLLIDEIYAEILNYHEIKNSSTKEDYINWLGKKGFRKITLSDGSKWLLKQGIQEEKYIHIHPAKYSSHSIRIRANTLKTAICLRLFYNQTDLSLETINEIRDSKLGLPPVKSLNSGSRIIDLWKLLKK